MSTRLVGYQPQYFPRLHYYARFLNADIYTISDYLQYVRKHQYPRPDGTRFRGVSYQAHTPIKTAQGLHLLDIPVKHSGTDGLQLMTEAQIEYLSPWREQHIQNIEHHYKKASQYERVMPSLRKLFEGEYDSLAAFTVATTLWGLAIILEIPVLAVESFSIPALNAALPFTGIRLTKIVRMSETDIPPPDKAGGFSTSEWLMEKCKRLGADEYYYGGTAAAAYAEFEGFAEKGIRVIQQDWRCGEYGQQFPKTPFIPNLSIIDLVMNVSPEEARRILSTPHQ